MKGGGVNSRIKKRREGGREGGKYDKNEKSKEDQGGRCEEEVGAEGKCGRGKVRRCR